MRSLAARVDRPRAGGAGAAGTILLHVSLLVVVVVPTGRGRERRLPAYQVELVAAPRAAQPAAQSAPQSPAIEQPQPDPPRTVAQPARTRPRPAPVQPPGDARKSEPTRPAAAAASAPAPGASLGTPGGSRADPATIRTEGVEFPFPGYLRNLVAQVYRRWRPPDDETELEAEVFFLVQRDGSINGLRFLRRSGAFVFDLEAQGAIEAAARAGSFGPLPAGYGADVLPVSFFFSPRSLR